MASNLRVDQITASTDGSVSIGTATFTGGLSGDITGLNVTGVITATTLNQNVTGVVTATGGFVVGTGATISGSTNTITASTNGSERFRIDSSGRVGIGTDSVPNYTRLALQGNNTDTGGEAVLRLCMGGTDPSSTESLGSINFSDGGQTSAAHIKGRRDSGTWTSGSSYPTYLEFATTADGLSSPTERARITSTGNLQIANGNLVFSTAGTGIDFSATSDAGGMTSELLDDYEEGTWIPTVEGLTTAGAPGGYYGRQGSYTKIGRMVYIRLNIGWYSHTGTGRLIVTGIPFTPAESSALTVSAVDGLTLSAGHYLEAGVTTAGGGYAQFTQYPTGGVTSASVNVDANVNYIIASGFYIV